MPPAPTDRLSRPMTSLRVSVTDRCNLRCEYCMPEAEYTWLPREDILDFDEITRLVQAFVRLGVRRVRLTGGEPLLRRDLPTLVRMLARIDGLDDLAMTTNGVLLADHVEALQAAGLHRVTVSLDTLDRAKFTRLTRADELVRVREGLAAAAKTFPGFKIDTVLVRGINDEEIEPLLHEARTLGAELRFIEYMDVGGATRWTYDQVIARDDILAILRRRGPVATLDDRGGAPAERFALANGQTFGIIASTTTPFCRTCDRSRLTADGHWYLCLYAPASYDLRSALRAGVSEDELAARLRTTWEARADRSAEERASSSDRRPLVPLTSLRRNPHLEMHTRGG